MRMKADKRQAILDYLKGSFLPAGLGAERDFLEERRIFREHTLSLKLWIVCHLRNRWTEFFSSELIAKNGMGSDPYYGLRDTSPLLLLAKCRNASKNRDWETRLDSVDTYAVLKGYMIPAAFDIRREISWSDEVGTLHIRYQEFPRMYLPCWVVKHPDFRWKAPIYLPMAPRLYPFKKDAKIVLLTDDLVCAQRNRPAGTQDGLGWCSFYSLDGGVDGIDFSPLKKKHVVFIAYPRKGTTNRQQLEAAERVKRTLEACGVSEISFAVYIDESYPRSTMLRLDPLLVNGDELHTLLEATERSSKVSLIPAWATKSFPAAPREIATHPDIPEGGVISLVGGTRPVRLAFLAALLGSLVKPDTLLPGMKCPVPGRVLGLVAGKELPELRQWLTHYKVLSPAESSDWTTLDDFEDPPSAIIRLLPISTDSLPELQWQPSAHYLDRRLEEMLAVRNALPVRLIVLDCTALKHKFPESLEVAAEFANYIRTLTARGIAILLLDSSCSWLTGSLAWTAKWTICNEVTSAAGVSFTLCKAGVKKNDLPYRLFLQPKLAWRRGELPSLEDQKAKIRQLYAKNRKKPFGSGKEHALTIQDIVNATGYGESQVKKLRILLGFSQRCPQRGNRRKSPYQ